MSKKNDSWTDDALIRQARGREFRDRHEYQTLQVDPRIDAAQPDQAPVIVVWFAAALRDPEHLDQVLRQVDAEIVDANIAAVMK